MLISVLLAASGAAAPVTDPLLPAKSGMVQCYEPNDQAHTCHSIGAYRQTGETTYDNTAQLPLKPDGSMTLEVSTPVSIEAGAVCGAIRTEDLAAGRLRVGGRLLDQSTARPILDKVVAAMAPLAGKRICTTYVGPGPILIAKATIDGVPEPNGDQRVEWVRADAGYHIGG